MFNYPWTNFHELNLSWFLEEWAKFKAVFRTPSATAETIPAEDPARVSVTELSEGGWRFDFGIPRGASISRTLSEYAISESQDTPPESGWTPFIPPVPQGFYLWTKITFVYSDDTSAVSYIVTRMGIDGTGSVVSVNGYLPNPDGNVVVPIPLASNNDPFGISPVGSAGLSEKFSRSDHIHPIGTIPVANGGTGATTAEGARTNLGITPAVNENMVDNPFFDINQRGFTSKSVGVAQEYTVDRWFTWRSNVSVSENGFSLRWNGIDGANGCLAQRFEFFNRLVGKTVTASAIVNGELYHFTGVFPAKGGQTIGMQIPVTGGAITFNIEFGSSFDYPQIILLSNSTTPAVIKAVKLEFGNVSTIEIENAPNEADELMKCQRYCIVVGTGELDQKRPIGLGVSSNAPNAFNILIPLPNVMRESGNVVVSRFADSSFGFVYGGGSYAEINGFSDPKFMGNGVGMALTGASSIPSFNAIEWAGAKLIISKDL